MIYIFKKLCIYDVMCNVTKQMRKDDFAMWFIDRYLDAGHFHLILCNLYFMY